MNRIEMAMSAALLLLHRRRCLVAVVSPPSSRRRRLVAVVSPPSSHRLYRAAFGRPARLACRSASLLCSSLILALATSWPMIQVPVITTISIIMLEGPLANRRPLRQGGSTAVGVEMSAQVVVYDRFLSSLWPLAGR